MQSINCPGCNNIFVKAALLIGHLERGACKEIPAWEFRGHIQQKYIQKEVLKNPEAFTFMTPVPEPVPSLEEPIAIGTDTESEGGVRLPILDQDNEQQKAGQAPLEAEVDLVTLQDGTRFPLTRANLETWPRLPGQKKSDVSSYLENFSISSDAGAPIDQISASEITSRRGGVKVYTPSYPSLQPHSPAYAEASSDSSSDSGKTAGADEVLKRPAAWKEQTTRSLFPNAKPTPPNAPTRSILKKHQDETQPMNPLKARWWEPGSKDYNPNLFFHSVTQKYCCPFPDCDQLPFDTPFDIDWHFMEIHARTSFRCASCCKLFKCAEGLVAHCESNGNCPIQKHDNFDKVCMGHLKHRALILMTFHSSSMRSRAASLRRRGFPSLPLSAWTSLSSSQTTTSRESCQCSTKPRCLTTRPALA